jgi:predicted alpha/beta-hydrolase family hydrolase
MDSAWMNDFCALLGDRGVRTARFEFAYMAARRQGDRRPPPRADTLLNEYVAAVRSAGVDRLVIGGKSMGGRVATMVADDVGAAGVVCLGYPFHAPGKPEQVRTAHLLTMTTPALICQGERDAFGTREELARYGLPSTIEVRWLADGDHDLRPRKARSGFTHVDHMATAANAVAEFTKRVLA